MTARERLARLGLNIEFEDHGGVRLTGTNGVSCVYSSSTFCPVIGMGSRSPGALIRLRRDGVAEVRLGGDVFEFSREQSAPLLEIPR